MKSFLYSVGLGVVGFFLAFYSMIHRYDYTGTDRTPAAINRSYDFSKLTGESLAKAAKARLVSALRIERGADYQALSLGHFAYDDGNGIKKFACDYYEKVQLVFEADGVASSGESPQMILEGKCSALPNDVGFIQPLVIPVARILGDLPADGDYKFPDFDNQSIQFKNMADQWPKLWILKRVSISKGVDELVVPAEEMGQLVGRPVVIKF